MTYAEKADIAAKAVKVLDSVTMTRQMDVAEKYAKLAMRKVKHLVISGGIASEIPYAEDLVRTIDRSLEGMKRRLSKPRYTLKDGEWVKKQARDPLQWLTSKEAKIVRDSQIASMAYDSRMGNAPLGAVSSDEHRAAQRRRNLEMAEKAERMAEAQNVGLGGASFDGGNPYVGLDQFHNAALRNPVIGTGQNSMLGAPEPSGAITIINR